MRYWYNPDGGASRGNFPDAFDRLLPLFGDRRAPEERVDQKLTVRAPNDERPLVKS